MSKQLFFELDARNKMKRGVDILANAVKAPGFGDRRKEMLQDIAILTGGVALLRAADALQDLSSANEDEATGIAIVKRALEEPLRQIVYNCGLEGSVVVQKVREGKGDYGFNARTEQYEQLFEAGVIDPAKVTRIAIENAVSIAGMMLTTECAVADKPKEETAAPAAPVMM